jgi:hypothetical protein
MGVFWHIQIASCECRLMVETPTSRGIPEPFRLAVQRGEIAACDTEERRKLFEPF